MGRKPTSAQQGGGLEEEEKAEGKEYAKIIAQAWADDEFKMRLLEDPAAVLR